MALFGSKEQPIMLDELEAAFNKGYSLFKAFENGKELASQLRAINQAVEQKQKDASELDKDIEDEEKELQKLRAEIEKVKKLSGKVIDEARADADKIKEKANKEAGELLAKSRAELDGLNEMIEAKKRECEEFSSAVAGLAKDLDNLQKQKAEFLAKLAG